ncbi:MAG TPA: flagellar basal body-associated FliL family protein [Candidatus Methylacidiphilales bacterium]|nr:flagellar basal body-associated FliL family protein [Candidatus Methylacidiphilales bacterium]
MAAKIAAEENAPKETAEGAEETPAPKPQGLFPVLISSAIMAIVLGGIGFAMAYFVLPGRLQASAPAAVPSPSTPIVDEKTASTAAQAAATGNKAVTKFTIEEITVNISDTRGNRFVRAGVYFDAPPPVLEELEANRARIIDTLGQVLSTKTLDDLTAPTIRGTLREELLGIINPTLKSGRIDNIYFTDLLVQ